MAFGTMQLLSRTLSILSGDYLRYCCAGPPSCTSPATALECTEEEPKEGRKPVHLGEGSPVLILCQKLIQLGVPASHRAG